MEYELSSTDSLVHVLAALRLTYLSHQNSHWQARGESYYGDHLLMQRLYESVQTDIDLLAEKIVGLFGENTIDLSYQFELLKDCVPCSGVLVVVNPIERAALIEEHTLDVIEDAYNKTEEDFTKTLGLDDLLMQLANNRESALYLLKQRLS